MKKIYILTDKIMSIRKRTAFVAMPLVMAFMFCLLSIEMLKAQTVVFSENFEHGGSMPSGWTQTYTSPEWQCVSSGIGNSSNPSSARGGTYCAGMYYGNTFCDFNYLLTPTMDLSQYTIATLTFYLHKKNWGSDSDEMIVYYRTSSSGNWTQLASYSSDIGSWQLQTINLPSLSSNYQIRFYGNACYGYGIYIDDVVVTGYSSSSCLTLNMSNNLTRTVDCSTRYCFYDSGGENGSYTNDETMTATFTSTGYITISFSSFDTESSYDYLKVYDGTAASGTMLLNVSGSSIPSSVMAHWIYLACVLVVLVCAYVLFMRKYYHLHEEYLKSL